MNTNAKGKRSERKTEDFLSKLGFIVETTRRSSYRGGNNDFFNLFDHVAVCQDPIIMENVVTSPLKTKRKTVKLYVPSQTAILIQTKSNTFPTKVWEEIIAFPYKKSFGILWLDRLPQPILIGHPYWITDTYLLKNV
jgi:hypothetical protein